MLDALVLGIFQGATYGLLAVGLVLVYKGTRVFNFAQGEFGTVAAYITWALYTKADDPTIRGHWLSYPLAALIAMVCVVLLGLIMERLVVRPLLNASRITLLVATVGVALLLIQIELIVGKPTTRFLAPAWSDNPKHPLSILGTLVTHQQLLIMLTLGVLAVLLFLFFRTDRGLAVLGLSQDPMAARIVGISVPGMSRFIWGSAAFLGAVAGILQAPVTIFQPAFMTGPGGALIPAFTAAVLGGMDSLAGAFIGGELVGIAQLEGFHFLESHQVPGSTDLTVFILLLVVLLARPRGLLGKEI